MARRLEGKVCIVTGAGRGIGRAIAGRLAREGAQVAVVDVDEASAKLAAEEIAEPGDEAIGLVCDVANRASVAKTIATVVARFGRLDVIFNNAGIAEIRPFLEVREEDWEKIMRVNALGVLICMQEAARQMIAQGDGGKIINTASIAGKQGYAIQPHYCASKAAVVSLTQAGARAFGQHGITVNAFCPGIVRTDLWKQLDNGFLHYGLTSRPGQAMEDFSADIILKRTSTSDDIAGLAAFLASDDASYITGQSIVVDGGMVLQ